MGNLTCLHFCQKSATCIISAKRENMLLNSTITNATDISFLNLKMFPAFVSYKIQLSSCLH